MVRASKDEVDEESAPFLNKPKSVTAGKSRKYEVGEVGLLSAAKAIILLCLFFAVNVVISVFNKWEFNGPLRCPIYVTMTHQIICFLFCFTISPWLKITPIEGWTVRWKTLLIPLFFVSNIALNNLSLLYTTLALNQLIRAFCPVVVATMSFLVEDKRPSWQSLLAIVTLMVGVTLSISTSPELEVVGTLICFLSVFGNALQTVIISILKIARLDPLSIIYHTSLYNTILMVPLFIGLGEHKQLYLHYQKQGLWTILGLTFVGGMIAFAYNVILLSFIQNTSSIYSSVAGSFKTVMVIFVSYLVFDQSLSTVTLAGICIACMAFIVHSVIMINEKRQAAGDNNKKVPSPEKSVSGEF
eukprot:711515-Amorphochlora_amoeboformis.AAC.1